jgi:transposase
MHYLAFDVSRDRADGVLLSPHLQVKQRFSIPNTTEELTSLILQCQKITSSLTVGAESTALFHLPVVEASEHCHVPCRILNPLLTKQFLKSSIRKRKTDREDAVVIAKLLSQDEGTSVTTKDICNPARVHGRALNKLTSLKTSCMMYLRTVQKRLGSVPASCTVALEALEHAREAMFEELEKDTPPEERRLLESIPGIGPRLSTTILAEIGSIERFHSGDSLIAYAGLDPKVRQSGAVLLSVGRMTKRGSPHLRRALFLAANLARMHDPELKAHYEKKRSEGKRHSAATCSVARKLTLRIFAVLKRKSGYKVHKVAMSPP